MVVDESEWFQDSSRNRRLTIWESSWNHGCGHESFCTASVAAPALRPTWNSKKWRWSVILFVTYQLHDYNSLYIWLLLNTTKKLQLVQNAEHWCQTCSVMLPTRDVLRCIFPLWSWGGHYLGVTHPALRPPVGHPWCRSMHISLWVVELLYYTAAAWAALVISRFQNTILVDDYYNFLHSLRCRYLGRCFYQTVYACPTQMIREYLLRRPTCDTIDIYTHISSYYFNYFILIFTLLNI